jgi:hypothetical protein
VPCRYVPKREFGGFGGLKLCEFWKPPKPPPPGKSRNEQREEDRSREKSKELKPCRASSLRHLAVGSRRHRVCALAPP